MWVVRTCMRNLASVLELPCHTGSGSDSAGRAFAQRSPLADAGGDLTRVAGRAPGREEELGRPRDLRPTPEHVVALGLDAVQDRRVQLAGHHDGKTPPPRDIFHPLVGDPVEPTRPVYLEAHPRDEALVHDAGGEVPLRVPETC